mmetsp:Transcript_46750/g.93069  ORF Transcript_46750/g.93069 Transcript_46750/m.93069 type:complete len:331 (-) Transcript_46750:349-1341(-)
MSDCACSRICLGKVVPWVSGFSALLAGILFLVEGSSGQGLVKIENLPHGYSWAVLGKDQLYTRWAHWTWCHELSVVSSKCTLKIFCWDRESIYTVCEGAAGAPIAAGVFSYMAGVFLLPLPVGYLNAATKKHVIMLTSISGVALLAGFISLTIMAVEQAKFADMWGDKFEKFHLSEAHQGSQLGGGFWMLLSAFLFSALVFIPTVLWLVFFTPQAPAKALAYRLPQRPVCFPASPAQNQPFTAQPVAPNSYGQPVSQGHWTAAGPRPVGAQTPPATGGHWSAAASQPVRPAQTPPDSFRYGEREKLRTSQKMPPLPVEAGARWSGRPEQE